MVVATVGWRRLTRRENRLAGTVKGNCEELWHDGKWLELHDGTVGLVTV